jgi:protein subunit release factor A
MKKSDLKITAGLSPNRQSGGQQVGTTCSFVTVEHIPTGTKVCIGIERSQLKNKKLAISLIELALEA